MPTTKAGALEDGTSPTRAKRKAVPTAALEKAIVKFKHYDSTPDPFTLVKSQPSQVLQQLSQPRTRVNGWRPKPKIVELLDLSAYSHQVNCSVPVGEPIFQPFPPEVTFFGYDAFKEYEALLCLRNNDLVPRSVKVQSPDSQYFSVQRLSGPDGAKVAPGMELVYSVTFRPQSQDDYRSELVVVTEREKYVVPLIAMGAAPALDLPDQLEFGTVATKTTKTQIVLVRNLGSRTSNFQLTCSQHFDVMPREGTLAPGELMQLRVSFTPSAMAVYEGELELRYCDLGLTAYTHLRGQAEDLTEGVALSHSLVTLLPTYVTKMSQKTFKIYNHSAEPVSFAIKAHGTAEEAAAAKRQQQETLLLSSQVLPDSPRHTTTAAEGDGDSEDEDAILSTRPLAQTQSLKDKARGLWLDQQLFGDKNFSCEPSSGTVMPGTECEVVVHFTPDYAREYTVTAYVDVQGRSERLPITFQAQGLGPAAVFSYDTLDVGDTYANTLHQYEVELQNRGKIDVQYALMPPGTPFGCKFTFEPDSGHLTGGQIQVIKVKLLSDLLGNFDEVFKWAIKGSSTPLVLQLKGRVRGPSCEVDTEALDFGIVAFGFRYTKDFVLSNTSEIPMKFCWRVPEDASNKIPEFQILPQKGVILPHGRQRITVEMTGSTVQRYANHRLVLDIPDVVQEQIVIPIRAECAVPKITAETSPLDFGDCFVRHPGKQTLRLVNQSKLPAKFDIQPQDMHSSGLASWVAEPMSGVVPACGEQQIEVTLTTRTLGRVQLPLRIVIPGSKGRPLEVTMDAKSLGPELLFGAEDCEAEAMAARTEVVYGTVPVLTEHTYTLQVHNPCLIPADAKLFVEGSNSVFSVAPSELHLDPGATAAATVTVTMDEARSFTDVLHVLVAEGADVCIPLSATGTGNTVVCKELAGGMLSFNHQFVGRPFERQLVIYNQGRKAQELVWNNARLDEVKMHHSKIARAAGKKFSIDMVPPEQQPVFQVSPDKLTLPAKQSAVITFSGCALQPGELSEHFTCVSMAKGKDGKPVFDFHAHALVATPLLDMSARTMTFHYSYVKGQPVAPIKQSLTLRNISKLPLQCLIRCPAPFTVDQTNFKLGLFEGVTLNITFDPAYKGDQQSGIVKQKLQISYLDNPQKDQVELVGVMDYPNLSMDKTAIEFGSCLSDTTARVPLTLTNTSPVDVVFHWAWDQDSLKEDANSIASMSMKTARQPKPPAIQLFDILPNKGVLKPGETMDSSFSFFAYPGVKASVTAMCMVEGGPTYQMPLSGESNNIKYAIEPQFIDMGQQLFTKAVERDITITNQGKVPFDFTINTSKLSRPSIVTPVPATGSVGPGSKATIKLRVLPGAPERLLETLQVELAHFDPIPLQLTVEGVYPALLLSLPRQPDPIFEACLEEATQQLMAPPALLAEPAVQSQSPTMVRRSPSQRNVDADARSVAGDNKSVTGMSVARSVGGMSRVTAKTGAGGKAAVQPKELSVERRAELAAERLRLVKVLAGAELERMRAAELAQLEAELLASQQLERELQQQADGDEAMLAEGDEDDARLQQAITQRPLSPNRVAPAVRTARPTASPSKAARKAGPIQPPIPELAAAHYVLDFGSVIKGATRSRKFKLTNPSSQVVSFKWDKAVLESWGLKAEPEAVSKLPGLPEVGSVECSLTLASGKRSVGLGPMQLTLPLPIKGSPPVLITITANIQMPDLEVSQESLNFGRVQVGQAKVITVQLHNHKPVPCEWEVKKPIEPTKNKDWAFFRCEPSQGVLEPGQRLNIKVIFTPVPHRDQPYQQAIPIKIASNPRGKELTCTASGDTPALLCEPNVVDCGAILPHTPGQAPNEARFKLVNPCPFPLEVVSLDFDHQYKEEEELLSVLEESRYNESGVMYAEPRVPGAPLWQDLAEAATARKALLAAQAAEDATAPGEQQGVGELEAAPAAAQPAEGDAVAAADSAAAEGGDDAKPVVKKLIVVHGTGMCGVSTQASKLANRYQLPRITLDDLLFEGADVEPPADLPPPPPEPAADNTPAKGKAPPATPPPDAKPPTDTSGEPKWDYTIADQLYSKVFLDPELAKDPGFTPPHTKLAANELHDLLLRGLRQAVAFSPLFQQGLVLDSLRCTYVDPATALRLVMQAMGMTPVQVAEPAAADPKGKGKAPAKPAAGKGGATPEPVVVPVPDYWEGPHQTYMVLLSGDQELTLQRLTARRAAEEQARAEQAAAEVAAAAAEQEDAEGEQAHVAEDTVEEPVVLSEEERAAAAEAKAAEEEAAKAAAQEALVTEAALLVGGAEQQLGTLQEWAGKAVGAALPDGSVVQHNALQVVRVPVTAQDAEEALHRLCCGLTFRLGVRQSVLPALPEDNHLIPPPYHMQVLTRPRERPPRQQVTKFKLFSVLPAPPEPPADQPPPTPPGPGKSPPKTPPKTPPKGGKAAEVVPEPVLNPLYQPASRWVLPPHSSQELVVQFQSEELGRFSNTFGFEIWSGDRPQVVTLPVTGTCDYPHISSDYRNVFLRKVKARPSTPNVSRQFIINKNQFEFGPLLVGKDPTGYVEGKHPDNTARLRITNNGLFPAHVQLSLQSAGAPGEETKGGKKAAPAAGKGGDKAAAKGGVDPVFTLSHTSLDLAVDETQEICLYAFPTQEGEVQDAVVCTITDNPDPVVFPISVLGAKPTARARLDDGSPDPYAATPATTAVAAPPADAKPKTPPKGGKAPVETGPVNKLLQEGIVFERLLVGKQETQHILISNPGVLPIHWRLAGCDALPPELKVYPSSGRLEARQDVRVAMEFTALEKREVAHKLTLEVLDVAELLGVASAVPIPIKAEAYKMEVDVKFPQEGQACLDYGTVRVCDSKQLPLVLKNQGKYQVKYQFTLRSAVAKELFTVQPESGVVDPGKDTPVQVLFNSSSALQRELTLVNAPDITLAIIEPLTSNKAETVPIRLSVRAVFTKYSITPARGIIFGPLTYNNTSKPRTFEIQNHGDFAFDYSLFNLATATPAAAAPATDKADAKKGGKAAPAAAGKGAKGGAPLTIGQFTVEPSEGSVEPGSKVEVSVVFKATGAQVFRESLGIDLSQRDPHDNPEGIPYELLGESCIPGIDTSSLESIFEEHTISASLDPAGAINNQLGLRERAFTFGPVIANLSAPASTPAAGKDKAAAPAAPSAGGARGGVQAALKFINPIKVPCTVNFSIKPRNPPQDPKAPQPFPMEVVPSQLVIPPQETRYTTLYFDPTAICQYSGTLEAVVEGGTDPQTKSFSCEVRGEGTIPSLTLLEPKAVDAHGQALLAFGRLLLNRSSQSVINLRNNGQLPATSRLEWDAHPAFSLRSGPTGTFTVQPGQSVGWTVEFRPTEQGAVSHQAHLRVQRNPFEEYTFTLTGEGYQDEVTLDMLPDNKVDTLTLVDAPLGVTRQAVFVLRNSTCNKHFRFKWPATTPSLTFSPSEGHLLAGAAKDITLTFKSDAPVKLAPAVTKLALSQITHAAAADGSAATPADWDSRSQVVEYDSEGQAVRKPEPEPKVTDVAGTNKELVLNVWATADNARYMCGAPAEGILFKPTMMFQTRAYTFPLTNTSTSLLSYKFTVLSEDEDAVDTSGLYSVSPQGGSVEPGASATITVRFAPTEVVPCARVLAAEIPGLDPAAGALRVRLDARVVRPWCHFDLVDSDYITAGRRDTGLPGPSGAAEPLDPATKVLEFESLGVKVRNTKRFLVLNPTGVSYEFAWSPVGPASSSSSSPFRCVTRQGTIGPGRQFEMVFEYTPQADEKTEAFWLFSIPQQNISLPFLLVGAVLEPRVAFDAPCINFGQCLIDGARGHGSVSLVNSEDLPFSFQLDKTSYEASDQQVALLGRRPAVEFSPASGVVPPHGSVTLNATFNPYEERLYNYNVTCKVSNKPTRLSLNVKGEGYAIRQLLQLEGSDGQSSTLTPNSTNHVDFGQVVINERSVRQVSLLNTGSLPYDFLWDSGTNPRISIKPESGTVGKGQRCTVELTYHPHGPDKLRDYRATCQVVNGPSYTLLLHGAGHKPRLDLSFTSHDFGMCAVWQPGMTSATKVLRLTNHDSQPIAVDPQWANQASRPAEAEVWGLDLPACVLQPGQSRDGTLTFQPAETKPYSQRLLLEINGLYTVGVDLSGEGAPIRVEPANPTNSVVNFGAVPHGSSGSRSTSLVNRGRVAVTLAVGAAAQEVLQRLGVEILPAAPVLLRPRERVDYTFFYRPAARVRPWTEELLLEANGVPMPLLRMAGSCSGTQLTLASDTLPFGPVAQGSSTVKRVALDNTGDTGTKFSWDTRALAPHFSIAPSEGFLAPGQSAKLEVMFRPAALSADIRTERVRCKVEGGQDQFLTLTGACSPATPQPDALTFSCAVRASASQSVALTNPSSAPWQLRPTINGDAFSGPEIVDVPAGGKAQYTVTYRPLSMTSSQPHEGSLFFGLPDGTGLLYRLSGTATTPQAEGVLERSITAKQQHKETLSVRNWLSRPQRFRVQVDRKAGDVATQLQAPQYVDVPALSSKDIVLTVFSYTPTVTQAVVTFSNEETKEFSFYELKFSAAPPARQGTLTLECPVRTLASTRVTLHNPLDTPVTVRSSASHKLVKVAPTTVLNPGVATQVAVTFRPLLVGSEEAVLKLESTELGVYEWGLALTGVATNPDKALLFNVPLGGRETQVYRFTHWLEDKADYKVSFGSGAKSMFEAPATVSVGPAPAGGSGLEATVEVVFEPSSLGEGLRDTLVLSSPTGGEYQVPLVGRCLAPRPQGPIDCSKGSSSVPFKNVFPADADFFYSVDNVAFQVKPSEKLGAKKPAAISVAFKPDPKVNANPAKTAKLTVTCPSQTSVSWVFYLQA